MTDSLRKKEQTSKRT